MVRTQSFSVFCCDLLVGDSVLMPGQDNYGTGGWCWHVDWQVVIVDESHYMKSRKSATTKFLVPLLQRADRKILLTGTPALNRPEEVFACMSYVTEMQSHWDYWSKAIKNESELTSLMWHTTSGIFFFCRTICFKLLLQFRLWNLRANKVNKSYVQGALNAFIVKHDHHVSDSFREPRPSLSELICALWPGISCIQDRPLRPS